MKKVISLLLAATMIVSLAACGSQSTTSTTETETTETEATEEETTDAAEAEDTTQKTFKIGLEVDHLDIDTMARFQVVFQRYCDEKGWELISSQNGEDSAVKVSNLENMITAGCDAIFSQNSDPSAVVDIYKQIVDAGILLVCYDSPDDSATYSFYCDNNDYGYAVGEMAAQWANENLENEVNVVAFQAPFAEYMVERFQGIVSGFKENCELDCVVNEVDINATNAADVIENSLQAYPDATVFLFPSDIDGYVAYQIIDPILQQSGADLSQYGIFGCDSTTAAVEAIAEGTIYRGTIDMGLYYDVPYAALEAISYSLTGEGTPAEKDNLNVFQQVMYENAEDYQAYLASVE